MQWTVLLWKFQLCSLDAVSSSFSHSSCLENGFVFTYVSEWQIAWDVIPPSAHNDLHAVLLLCLVLIGFSRCPVRVGELCRRQTCNRNLHPFMFYTFGNAVAYLISDGNSLVFSLNSQSWTHLFPISMFHFVLVHSHLYKTLLLVDLLHRIALCHLPCSTDQIETSLTLMI